MMNWNKDGIEKDRRKKTTDEAREAGRRERGGGVCWLALPL